MRQVIKKLYLFLISVFNILWSHKKIDAHHIVLFMSFKEDIWPLVQRFHEEGYRLTIIGKEKDKQQVTQLSGVDYVINSNKHVVAQLKALATAKVIFVDNYYLLMGGYRKKKGQTVIQTWHAAGALKNFGLKDHAVDLSNKKMVDQYLKVYQATDYYLIGGDPMEDCFKQAFGATSKQMLRFGLPRMQQYFTVNIEQQKEQLKQHYGIKDKLAVYVPTYREHQAANRHIDTQRFEQALPGYTIINQLHPAVRQEITSNIETQHLFLMADVIITDYSSLAIEAALLNKPALFYVYDQAAYEAERGLNPYYWQIPEHYKAYNETDLLHKLKEGLEHYPPRFKAWHTYNTDETINQISNYIRELVKR
ncbi:teichoic acid glycerol-phosphate primase TarB [Staphylococcus simulans]